MSCCGCSGQGDNVDHSNACDECRRSGKTHDGEACQDGNGMDDDHQWFCPAHKDEHGKDVNIGYGCDVCRCCVEAYITYVEVRKVEIKLAAAEARANAVLLKWLAAEARADVAEAKLAIVEARVMGWTTKRRWLPRRTPRVSS
jgi:hypothetical protein